MPTQAALDIVNALFAGQKDLSDFVAAGMKDAAMSAIDAKKVEVGKSFMNPSDEEEEGEEEVETPAAETEQPESPEETTDETD